jgi:hypothetical protein
MKYRLMLAACAFVAACNATKQGTDFASLPANTLLAADSVKVVEDSLNNTFFSVKLLTSDKTAKGIYNVNAAWGYNIAASKFTLPKGAEQFKPALHREAAPYSFMIGFHMEDDTTFYPYYQVKAEEGTIKMNYVRSYSFE